MISRHSKPILTAWQNAIPLSPTFTDVQPPVFHDGLDYGVQFLDIKAKAENPRRSTNNVHGPPVGASCIGTYSINEAALRPKPVFHRSTYLGFPQLSHQAMIYELLQIVVAS